MIVKDLDKSEKNIEIVKLIREIFCEFDKYTPYPEVAYISIFLASKLPL